MSFELLELSSMMGERRRRAGRNADFRRASTHPHFIVTKSKSGFGGLLDGWILNPLLVESI